MSSNTLPSISLRSTLNSVTAPTRRGPTGALEADAAPQPAQRPAPADAFRNIRLQFKIDPKTNDVTVLMVDVNARKVVRSIPAEELQQLDQGELVQLLA